MTPTETDDALQTPVVLLIEDEQGDAELIRWQLLERADDAFAVHIADSLASARLLIERERLIPDVILLDLNLPDSSGPQTVPRCRSLTDAPIVVLTGLDDVAATQRAIDLGAEDYLTKGGEGSSLRRAIRYAMLRHRREADSRLAATVFSHSREGIVITTPDGVIIDVNEAFSRITGYPRDEVIGRNPGLLKSHRQGPVFYAQMWRALIDDGYWAGELWNRRKDGEEYAELLTISAVRDSTGNTRHYVALFTDITAQKQHQQQLEFIAHYDSLTRLPNRMLLADRLGHALTQTRRHRLLLAVAYIDLDGFKAVNDTYGHAAGDVLLVTVAERMKRCLRESDTIARLGGDEFVAILTELPDMAASAPLIDRLLAAAAEPVDYQGAALQVSSSIGVTFHLPDDDSDADLLLRQADQAMYQAKLAGKNRYYVFANRAGCVG